MQIALYLQRLPGKCTSRLSETYILGIGDPLEKVQNIIGRLVGNAYKVVETF
jgi:hypothetical protein